MIMIVHRLEDPSKGNRQHTPLIRASMSGWSGPNEVSDDESSRDHSSWVSRTFLLCYETAGYLLLLSGDG